MNYNSTKHRRRSIRLPGYDYSQPGFYFVTICLNHTLENATNTPTVGAVPPCPPRYYQNSHSQNHSIPRHPPTHSPSLSLSSSLSLPLLSYIEDGCIYPTEAGQMVQTVWNELPLNYSGVDIDAFVLMPDHIHGIIILENDQACPSTVKNKIKKTMKLGEVVHRFKSLTTAKYRHGVKELNWIPFEKRFWQRNYYETIIRDEFSLEQIRQYIIQNPLRWELESHHQQKYHPKPIL